MLVEKRVWGCLVRSPCAGDGFGVFEFVLEGEEKAREGYKSAGEEEDDGLHGRAVALAADGNLRAALSEADE